MSYPRVSILIPVYNRSEYIGECINSALDQNFKDIEVVVVDNASDDGTWAICQHIAELDARVRIFRNEKNIGPVRNWIRCAEEARGQYSKILFSDDLLEPTCVTKMHAKLQKTDIGFVFCAASIGPSKCQSRISYSSGTDQLITASEYLPLIIKGKAPVSPGAVMIRTADLLKNLHTDFPTRINQPYSTNGAGPDMMIMLLTASQYPRVAWINDTLVFFRAHSGSFTIQNKDSKVTDNYDSIISWYLINNYKRYSWIHYVTILWLRSLKNKNIKNPYIFLKNYESDGRFSDLFCLIALIPIVMFKRIILKKIK